MVRWWSVGRCSVGWWSVDLIKPTSMEHSFKTKSTKSRTTFLRQQRLFWISSCISLGKHKDTGVVHQLTKTAIFIVTPMKKSFSSSFNWCKGCFASVCCRKIMGLVSKYYMLAGDTSQVSIFFPCIRQKWVNNVDYLSSKLPLTSYRFNVNHYD